MKPKTYFGIAISAILGSVAATVANPTVGPSLMMATGAAFLAHSVAKEESDKAAAIKTEANKVGAAFKYLYELNGGIIVPAQLAFHSDIGVDRATNFLIQLANTQGGNAVSTETGQSFVFPHPRGTVEELEKRYLAYAQSEIQNQTGQLQQQLMQLQAHLNVLTTAQTAPAMQKPQREDEPLTDPWNKLV